MRLIDADEIFNWGENRIKDAVKYGNKTPEQQRWSYSTLMMYEVADEIDDAPTVDAVLVVRCRDCIHAIKNSYEVCFCDVHEDYCDTNDYCSYGKRMDGGEEA